MTRFMINLYHPFLWPGLWSVVWTIYDPFYDQFMIRFMTRFMISFMIRFMTRFMITFMTSFMILLDALVSWSVLRSIWESGEHLKGISKFPGVTSKQTGDRPLSNFTTDCSQESKTWLFELVRIEVSEIFRCSSFERNTHWRVLNHGRWSWHAMLSRARSHSGPSYTIKTNEFRNCHRVGPKCMKKCRRNKLGLQLVVSVAAASGAYASRKTTQDFQKTIIFLNFLF